MTDYLHHQIEVSGGTATVYLAGTLDVEHAGLLLDACQQLPPAVRALRLDLHGVTALGDDAMDALRRVLQLWRRTRGGHFTLSLSSEHVVATVSEGQCAGRAAQRVGTWSVPSPALTAAFL